MNKYNTIQALLLINPQAAAATVQSMRQVDMRSKIDTADRKNVLDW